MQITQHMRGVSVVGLAILLVAVVGMSVAIALYMLGVFQAQAGELNAQISGVSAYVEGSSVCVYFTVTVLTGGTSRPPDVHASPPWNNNWYGMARAPGFGADSPWTLKAGQSGLYRYCRTANQFGGTVTPGTPLQVRMVMYWGGGAHRKAYGPFHVVVQ